MAHQQELLDDFSANREGHYRRQLIALQNDMNLITHADPYMPEPIEDSPEEVARLAEQAASGTPYQSEMSSLAGKWYAEFVHEVNEAKEAKELALIQLAVRSSCSADATMLTNVSEQPQCSSRTSQIRMRLPIASCRGRMRTHDLHPSRKTSHTPIGQETATYEREGAA